MAKPRLEYCYCPSSRSGQLALLGLFGVQLLRAMKKYDKKLYDHRNLRSMPIFASQTSGKDAFDGTWVSEFKLWGAAFGCRVYYGSFPYALELSI